MPVLLIRPPFVPTSFDQQFQEPLNLCYLAAVLRHEGHEVRLLDAEFGELTAGQIIQEIADERPSLVGISLMSEGGLAGTLEIIEGIRQWAAPDAHVTVGGHFVTFNTAYLLRMAPAIDSVVLYEGELTTRELARRVVLCAGDWRQTPGIAFSGDGPGREPCRTAPAPPILDLDALPFPTRDFLPRALQLGLQPTILSSRGCSGRCSFCTIHDFVRVASGKAWRARSPENVGAEIKGLVENYRVGEVGFLDDDFIGTPTAGKQRARALADLLIREKLDILYNFECRPDMVDRELFARLRDSGLRSVFLGVEGVSEGALRVFNKGTTRDVACRAIETLRDLGIEADAGFILYHPYATMQEVREGYEFLKQYGQCDVHTALNRLFIVPGAPLRERLLAEGRLRNAGCQSCLESEEYDYADSRVGLLLSILQIAVSPLFPWWYNGIKEFRRLRSARKFEPDPEPADQRMRRLAAFTAGVDGVVEGCFEEAFAYAHGGVRRDGLDLLQFSRRLMRQAQERVRSLAGEFGCTECLTT